MWVCGLHVALLQSGAQLRVVAGLAGWGFQTIEQQGQLPVLPVCDSVPV